MIDLNACTNQELQELVLGNWHQLNRVLEGLSAPTIYKCLVLELSGQRRTGIVERLHTRYMSVRKKELNDRLVDFVKEAKKEKYDAAAIQERLIDFYVL